MNYNLLSPDYLSTSSTRTGYVTLLLGLYRIQILIEQLRHKAQDGPSDDNLIEIYTKTLYQCIPLGILWVSILHG